jgi:putative ABC transport system permease protein
MVGVGVVTLFTVFAASLKTSINHDVSQSFRGDLAVTTPRFGGGLSPSLVPAVAALPQVATATGLGGGNARISGHTEKVSVVDSSKIDQVLDLGGANGSLAGLQGRQLAVSKKTADDKGWRIGTSLQVTFPDGSNTNLTVSPDLSSGGGAELG